MSTIGRLLRPAAHVPRLPEDAVQATYPKFRWRILEATFILAAIVLLALTWRLSPKTVAAGVERRRAAGE